VSTSEGPDEHRSTRRRTVVLAIGALFGAGVLWGSLRPDRTRRTGTLISRPVTVDGAAGTGAGVTDVAATAPSDTGSSDGLRPPSDHPDSWSAPRWVRPTIVWTIGLVVLVVVGLVLLRSIGSVVAYLLLALFFSFAMEPAVNYLHTRWHWRRGPATGLLLGLVALGMVVLVLVFVPTLLKGASAIAARLPGAARELQTWARDHLGVDVATASIESGTQDAASALASSSHHPLSALTGFTASLIGGVFGAFTVAMFTFYMVAEASQFRRVVLSFFPPRRQEELLSIWEAAIEKTGGYFYSRLLLAGINGGLFFIVLRIVGVPGAAALAFFEGSVAAFIPIVGTYISATVPIVVAFITVGSRGALVLLIYVLIYQQVENYLLSPRIQGKTMQLHPAVAFGAALAGGALGGLLWAFLALPFAATMQASASLWFQRHEVVDSQLTHVEAPPLAPDGQVTTSVSILERGGRILRSSRGWIRKVV
jgi:predicted PurR-regulated permease PerM